MKLEQIRVNVDNFNYRIIVICLNNRIITGVPFESLLLLIGSLFLALCRASRIDLDGNLRVCTAVVR